MGDNRFHSLINEDGADVIQPEIQWAGGMTATLRIAAMARARDLPVILHSCGVYSYHFTMSQIESPYAEYYVPGDGTKVIPKRHAIIGEPAPDNGYVVLSDKPGFGIELERSLLGPSAELAPVTAQSDYRQALSPAVAANHTHARGDRCALSLYCDAQGSSNRRWETTADGNWCAGYWIGLLWIAAGHSPPGAERDRFLAAAYDHLSALLAQPTAHIFAGLNYHYAGFLGFDLTGDDELRSVGLRGADLMLNLYNPAARQIPIGIYATAPEHESRTSRTPLDRSNFAAVDVIHTSLPILLRAHAESGREVYRETAMAHAKRHLSGIRPRVDKPADHVRHR